MFTSDIRGISGESRAFECNCRRIESGNFRRRFICTQVGDIDFEGRLTTRFICREIQGNERDIF